MKKLISIVAALPLLAACSPSNITKFNGDSIILTRDILTSESRESMQYRANDACQRSQAKGKPRAAGADRDILSAIDGKSGRIPVDR